MGLLDDVDSGAGSECGIDVRRLVRHGEDDRLRFLEALTDVEEPGRASRGPVRHRDLDHDEVGPVLFDQRGRLSQRRRLGDDLDGNALQHLLDGVKPERVLVDDDCGANQYASPSLTATWTYLRAREAVCKAVDNRFT